MNLAARQVEGLRKMAEAASEPIGRRRIGKIEAKASASGKGSRKLLVSVDPKAKVPLRIDLKTQVNDVEVPVSLADFQLDPSLDNGLFRFEPPPAIR